MPGHRRIGIIAVDDKIMALWFSRNGGLDSMGQYFVISGGAQWCAKIGGIVLTQAHKQGAGAS